MPETHEPTVSRGATRRIWRIVAGACAIAGFLIAAGELFFASRWLGIGIGLSAGGAVVYLITLLVAHSAGDNEVVLPVIRAKDWDELRRVADDGHKLPESFEEWCDTDKRLKEGFESFSMRWVEVPIDLAALREWCAANGKRNTAGNRAAFAEELHKRQKRGLAAQAGSDGEPC